MTKKISLVILIFAALAAFAPAVDVLELKSRKEALQHYYSHQAYKEGFVISYTHSVNKGRIHDYYRVKNRERLELYQTDFVSYGAGIPEADEMPGAVFSVNGNTYSITNINRVLDRFVMAVGLIAEHSITIGSIENEERYLTKYFPAQTSIIIETKKVSLLSYLIRKKI